MKKENELKFAEIPSINENQVGTELRDKFNNEEQKLFDYSKALASLISIYPTLGSSYMQLESPKDELTVECIQKEEVSARLENFYTYKIVSSTCDEKELENRQSQQKKINSVIQELKGSFGGFSFVPVIAYGFAARNGKSFMFFGVQKCFSEDLDEMKETNNNLKNQIEMILHSKGFKIEPVENLFVNHNTNTYTGVNFGFPSKDPRDTNLYNELFTMAEEEKSDFTLLVLAKPVSDIQRNEFKQQLNGIYTEFQKTTDITKSISKLQKQRIEISETNTTQEEVTTVTTMDRFVEATPALAGIATGALGGAILGTSLVAIPIVGKKLAWVGVPVLAITGAILGTKYLPELVSPITQVIHQVRTEKTVNIHSLTTTFAEEFGFQEKLEYTITDLLVKELAQLAEDAYKRFQNKKDTVWQTVITYSADSKAVRNILHAKAGLVTGSGEEYAANEKSTPDTPEYIIPDNFFRTDGSVYPNEISNFISGEELGSIIYLPNKSFDGFSLNGIL